MSTGPRPPKGSVTALVQRFVQPGHVFVDVGANIGTISAVVKDRCTVIAFEPDQRCWATLAATGVNVEPVALGEHTRPGVLYQNATSVTSSLYPKACDHWTTQVPVAIRCLDDVVSHADVVKIDAQGSEIAILRGASDLLRTCPVWILELWPYGLTAAGEDPMTLHDLLTEAGLSVTWANDVPCPRQDLVDWLALDPRKVARHVNLIARR